MKASFDYFAPPGESRVSTYGPNFKLKKAVATVSQLLIVNGVECQPFDQIAVKEGEQVRHQKKLTELPDLPAGTVLVKNNGKTDVYLRVMLEGEEIEPESNQEQPPKLSASKPKKPAEPPAETKPSEQ